MKLRHVSARAWATKMKRSGFPTRRRGNPGAILVLAVIGAAVWASPAMAAEALFPRGPGSTSAFPSCFR